MFTLFLFTQLPLFLEAASFDYGFGRLTIDDGLSANHVKALLRGKDGFVWIGTVNGLNRFDGVNIKKYHCFDKNMQKGNDNIGVLFESNDGIIWIGTDRGVYTYAPKKDEISYVDIWDKETGGLNWVQRINGDTKGNIWVLVPDQGIFRKSDEGTKIYQMPSGSKYKEDYFNDICLDEDATLWACTSNGKIFRYDKGYD